MAEPLFRAEVAAARPSRWLGGISVGQPVGVWALTMLGVAVAAAVVVLLFFGEHARRNRVAGQLVPSAGMASVSAPGAGFLLEVRVQEGARVHAGDVLAVVSAPRATRQDGDVADATRRAIGLRHDSLREGYRSQRRQLLAQDAGLRGQSDALMEELRVMGREVQTRKQRQHLAQLGLDQLRRLEQRRFVTVAQVQQQQAVVLAEVASLQALERGALSLRRELARLGQARDELLPRLASLEAVEKGDRSRLDQEALESGALAEAVVRSPVTGTVGSLLGQPGQAVQAGQILLSLLPEPARLEAHLWVPSRAVGFVAPGDRVRLRYQAFPYQKFGQHQGRVTRVSRSALGASELRALTENAEGGEPLYRIVVQLDRQSVRAFGKDESLKPGMLLDADIVGEKRSLWEWALEPLMAVGHRIGSE